MHLNRVLRENGFITIREEFGREVLDAGASAAFAVADHQIAHVYVNDASRIESVAAILERRPASPRSFATPTSGGCTSITNAPAIWSPSPSRMRGSPITTGSTTRAAPDFARTVDIHRKPGYDPAELFIDPNIAAPKLKIAWTLLKQKLGFRSLLDVIPLDATLVKGSHGLPPRDPNDGAMLASNTPDLLPSSSIDAIDVCKLILSHLFD